MKTGIRLTPDSVFYNDIFLSANTGKRVGFHVDSNRSLYFNDTFLAQGDASKKGLYTKDGRVMLDNSIIGGDSGVDTSEFSAEGFWIAPPQENAIAMRNWKYSQWIDAYDKLVEIEPRFTKHRYEDGEGNPIINPDAPYELFHYVYEPENYTKTIFMQAQIHGNEKDCRITVYRMFEILFKKRNMVGYTAWQDIYKNCRLIVIPVVNPYGNDNSVHYSKIGDKNASTNGMYDFNHQHVSERGSTGDSPFAIAELQHSRDVVLKYDPRNIDLAIDFHDGFNWAYHYMILYNVDGRVVKPLHKFLYYMLDKKGVAVEDARIPDYMDINYRGLAGNWFGKTMGMTSITNEYLGGIGGDASGYFGYNFDSEQTTHSLEIRSNMLFIALNNDVKEWQIREPVDAAYFHFDYPKTFTRETLRKDGFYERTWVTPEKIKLRWDALLEKHPDKLTKSGVLGVSTTGTNIHSYTFGNGAKKVLMLAGKMRSAVDNRIDEFAAYQLVDYLCDDYIVNQSKFLRDLRDNYKIVVLPYSTTNIGINDGDALGTSVSKAFIDANSDAKVIFAGGEEVAGYPTNYQTQIIQPKSQSVSLAKYINHLSVDRNELTSEAKTDGSTILDYAYDTHKINAYYVNLNISSKYDEYKAWSQVPPDEYIYLNYEAGRRIANIANLFLL